jgi:hypothetical protein
VGVAVERPGGELHVLGAARRRCCQGGLHQRSTDASTSEGCFDTDMIDLVPVACQAKGVLWALVLSHQQVAHGVPGDLGDPAARRGFL